MPVPRIAADSWPREMSGDGSACRILRSTRTRSPELPPDQRTHTDVPDPSSASRRNSAQLHCPGCSPSDSCCSRCHSDAAQIETHDCSTGCRDPNDESGHSHHHDGRKPSESLPETVAFKTVLLASHIKTHRHSHLPLESPERCKHQHRCSR